MVRMWAPEADFDEAYAFINDLELGTAGSTVALPGSLALLSSLPSGSWTICTSAGRELGLARVRAAGLPVPLEFVCGDDVLLGKPAPDPYLLGATRLGLSPLVCAVFEDAVAGVASARAAGVGVVVGIGSRVLSSDCSVVVSSLAGISWSDGILEVSESHILKG